jgi:CRP/FNR family transcriptional regulator, nitrogen fixation regulation protein
VHGQIIQRSQQSSNINHLARQLTTSVHVKSFDRLIDRIGICMSFAPQACIFHENDPAESTYKVVSGSVRTCKFFRDGRRQIGGFYLPNDFFGLESADRYTLSAEAITNAKVLMIKKSMLAAAVKHDAAIEYQLLLLANRELARLQARVLLLIKNAQERVGEFILEMEKRSKIGNSNQLPMKRQDIADYLGLTIETVSRMFTSLESCAAIQMPTSRRIVLRSHSALRTAIEDPSKTNPVYFRLKLTNEKKSHSRRRCSVNHDHHANHHQLDFDRATLSSN